MSRTIIQSKKHDDFAKQSIDSLLVFLLLLFFGKISSKSITFSYRTCLPNIDLIDIEHHHSLNSQRLQLFTKDFHLHILYTYQTKNEDFQFGTRTILTSNLSNFEHQFQSAINYYHQIDTWNYVNITFDDHLSRIYVSFNNDETRLIPLIEYPLFFQNQTIESKLDAEILVNERDRNVTCLLPYSGFNNEKSLSTNPCSTDIKTCGKCRELSKMRERGIDMNFLEHRICTSMNNAEQYCSLFKIFDCHPFTGRKNGIFLEKIRVILVARCELWIEILPCTMFGEFLSQSRHLSCGYVTKCFPMRLSRR